MIQAQVSVYGEENIVNGRDCLTKSVLYNIENVNNPSWYWDEKAFRLIISKVCTKKDEKD